LVRKPILFAPICYLANFINYIWKGHHQIQTHSEYWESGLRILRDNVIRPQYFAIKDEERIKSDTIASKWVLSK
jgi:hypothetical protein